jgi:RNA polymerase primary sigma factor
MSSPDSVLGVKARRKVVAAAINDLKPKFQNQKEALADEEYRALAWEYVELNKPLIKFLMRGMFLGEKTRRLREDIEQDLLLPLLAAVWNHEPTYGAFSTYAVACVRPHIYKFTNGYIREDRNPVSIPKSYSRQQVDSLAEGLETSRSEERISRDEWERRKPIMDRLYLAAHQGYMRIRAETAHTGEQGERTPHNAEEYISTLPDPSDPYSSVMHNDLRCMLLTALESLSEREAAIIRERFGLDREGAKTLQTVADMHGVTRERIRQIEMNGLRKLRNPSRSRMFRDYQEDIGIFHDDNTD